MSVFSRISSSTFHWQTDALFVSFAARATVWTWYNARAFITRLWFVHDPTLMRCSAVLSLFVSSRIRFHALSFLAFLPSHLVWLWVFNANQTTLMNTSMVTKLFNSSWWLLQYRRKRGNWNECDASLLSVCDPNIPDETCSHPERFWTTYYVNVNFSASECSGAVLDQYFYEKQC